MVDNFLAGYKELTIKGTRIGDKELATTFNLAKEVNISKQLNLPPTKSWEVMDRVVYIDSVAHSLHQIHKKGITSSTSPSTSPPTTIGGPYPVLDELAEISKSMGEVNRDDRLLILNKMADNRTLDSLNSVSVFSKSLDRSTSYWKTCKKAIRNGVEDLTDDELIELREWIYARI